MGSTPKPETLKRNLVGNIRANVELSSTLISPTKLHIKTSCLNQIWDLGFIYDLGCWKTAFSYLSLLPVSHTALSTSAEAHGNWGFLLHCSVSWQSPTQVCLGFAGSQNCQDSYALFSVTTFLYVVRFLETQRNWYNRSLWLAISGCLWRFSAGSQAYWSVVYCKPCKWICCTHSSN